MMNDWQDTLGLQLQEDLRSVDGEIQLLEEALRLPRTGLTALDVSEKRGRLAELEIRQSALRLSLQAHRIQRERERGMDR
jgi:hypothetical protein